MNPDILNEMVRKVEGVRLSSGNDTTLADVLVALDTLAKTAGGESRLSRQDPRFQLVLRHMDGILNRALPELNRKGPNAPPEWREETHKNVETIGRANAHLDAATGLTEAGRLAESLQRIEEGYAGNSQVTTAIGVIRRAFEDELTQIRFQRHLTPQEVMELGTHYKSLARPPREGDLPSF